MKKIFLLMMLFVGISSFAQILNPVKWEFSKEQISDNEYMLIFTANLDEHWAVYSQFIDKGGPVPTSFSFDKGDFELIDKVVESEENKVSKKDPLFGDVVVTKFYDKAVFKQKVKLLNKDAVIKGSVEFMSCDNAHCLPPTDESFTFSFGETANQTTDGNNVAGVAVDNSSSDQLLYGITPDDLKRSTETCGAKAVRETEAGGKGKSLWSVFGLGLLGGLLALLTPCVFPMIPLTVSFFTKKEGSKSKGSGITSAVLYGLFILLVYVLLSVPFHLLDTINPDILNDISTNIWLNIAFFVIFVFFAFSFFGYYELTLPSGWTSKTSQGESIGGILGIFFMALTLAIVSFSCTGPILGSLLAGSLSADGGAWQLTAGMAGFGIALGLPFALFAMFPNMLNALPKSGGWLNTVKVVLGFLELALAFKFLSNADLVKHWGILKIEPFLIIWIVIFAGLALYLFGKIKFPHDSPIKKLSFPRIAFGILVAAFTVYLISGFRVNKDTNTFTSLRILSGLAPPVTYSIFKPQDCPNNIACFKDLKDGIAYAKKVNKPIMLDFTGYACVNCRKMEEHVWSSKQIDKYLRDDYVLISLYVDNKIELPEDQKVKVNRVNGGTRALENYGHKWAHFQTRYFNSNSQPFYVLLTSDGKTMLNKPAGYTPDTGQYKQFLQCGLDQFEKMK